MTKSEPKSRRHDRFVGQHRLKEEEEEERRGEERSSQSRVIIESFVADVPFEFVGKISSTSRRGEPRHIESCSAARHIE